jgi:tRNA pseudouridine55 synthase
VTAAQHRPAADGLIIVDKPGGLTSHDVVARVRRLAGTRRVGHAGTLDPMATGVLVTGIGKATRLLGHLALSEKEYTATIRLGQATDTDDAEGQVVSQTPASGVTDAALAAAAAALTGEIQQVPPGFSAIKVDGKRAYRMAREGAAPELAARTVTVRTLNILAVRRPDPDQRACVPGQPGPGLVDLDVDVTCSSGTYIRALARDLGASLGVGGHLTALRRTRVGHYEIAAARTLDQLGDSLEVIALADAAASAFRRRDLTQDETRRVAHGGRLSLSAADGEPVAAFAPDGSLIALLADEAGQARSLAVFVP